MVVLVAKITRLACSRLLLSRTLGTTRVQLDDVKTPIQEVGWEYLQKQKDLNRPISPHLTIYAPQYTWVVSGFHRISGCVMAGVLLVGGVGFAVLPIDFTTFINFFRDLGIPCAITALFKWIIAFPIVFHTLNGIRFIGFDMAKGTDLPSVYKSAYLVLALSALISTVVVAIAVSNKDKPKAAVCPKKAAAL